MSTLITRPREVAFPPWTMSRVARTVYRQLGPLTYPDSENGFTLAALVEGWCTPAALLDDGMRPEPGTGEPPWARVVDPARCPWWALRWCGQLYGLRLLPALGPWERPNADTEARWREEIRGRARWRRGTATTLMAIAKSHTKGQQRIQMRLRYDPAHPDVDSPWHIQIRIRESDLIDGDAAGAIRDLEAAAPAGVVINVDVTNSRDWQDVKSDYLNWSAVKAGNTDWADVLTP